MDAVGDIMTKRVITCPAEDSLLEIQKLLVKHRTSRVVVADREKKPTGILTQKDIVNFLLADKSKCACASEARRLVFWRKETHV